jgi:UDP-N-acetylmuramoyl-L-alanyl-D-glutamate--2,6-diaminopimelate ligase
MSLAPPPAAPDWSSDLFTVGVTGTNGKTTTTMMIAAALAELLRPVASATTLGFFLDDERLEVPPHHEGFIQTMRRCLDAGGRYAAVEFTSEALALGAAKAWPCRIGIFTNLSHDHRDAHGTAEHYLASKAQLFMALPSGGTAVLNGCDPAAALIAEVLPAGVKAIRYGIRSRGEPWAELDLDARSVRVSWSGTQVELDPGARFEGAPKAFELRAIGAVFAENALAALAATAAAGVPIAAAADLLGRWIPPPGRFELVAERPHVVIDYAHSPDALTRTLATARSLCKGRLTVVFGAGGDRDRQKRPLLGAAAAATDRVILTSDNPRSEDPRKIAQEIRAGIEAHPAVEEELDRARAIEVAIRDAAAEDVIVIAGKGHELEQVTRGNRMRFSDRETALAVCARRLPT